MSARDIGLAAATVLRSPTEAATNGDATAAEVHVVPYSGNMSIEVAGDELTPYQMAATFSAVQGSPVRYVRAPAWPFWIINRDLYRIAK